MNSRRDRPPEPEPEQSRLRGFRPTSRRRARIAAGSALAAIAVAGNVLVYSSLGDSTEVLQVVSNVRPGQLLTANDFQVVSVDVDGSVPVVPATQLASVTNQYSRVYIAAGTLMVETFVQPTPLISDGTSVVAIEIRSTRVPAGLRERSRVSLIGAGVDGGPALVVEGRVVSRGELGTDTSGAAELIVSLSIEVPASSAPTVAASDDIRVALLDPGVDPATEGGA